MNKIKTITMFMVALLVALEPLCVCADSTLKPNEILLHHKNNDRQRMPSKNPDIIIMYYDGNILSASIAETECESCTLTVAGVTTATYYISVAQLQGGVEIGSYDYGELTLTFDDGRTYVGEITD